MNLWNTIGASGRTVVTILATAGAASLMWWQWPTSEPPIYPQTGWQAALTHATLNRLTAMGNETNFITTVPANVSQIVTGSIPRLKVVGSVTSGSDAIVYSVNGLGYCAWPSSGVYLATNGGTIVSTHTHGNGYVNLPLSISGGKWKTGPLTVSDYQSIDYWMSSTNTLPATLHPYRYSNNEALSDSLGTIVLSLSTSNLYQFVTNSPAVVFTNVVGLYPSLTELSSAVRLAVHPWVASGTPGDPYDPPYYNAEWILPSNDTQGVCLDSTVFNGKFVYPLNILSTGYPNELYAEQNYWTNYITLNMAHRIAQTNYWDGTCIVWTNGVAYTNQYPATNSGSSVTAPSTNAGHRSTTNYAYLSSCNPWTNKQFAFERDNTPYTWSTNSYNDMARILALMQWQMMPLTFTATNDIVFYRSRYDGTWNVVTNPPHYSGTMMHASISTYPVPGYYTYAEFIYYAGYWGVGTNTTPFTRILSTPDYRCSAIQTYGIDLTTNALFIPLISCISNSCHFTAGQEQAAYGPPAHCVPVVDAGGIPTLADVQAFFNLAEATYAGDIYIDVYGEGNSGFGSAQYATPRILVNDVITNYLDHAPAR